MSKLPLVLVINDVRSAYNVGSMWRTADAVGAERIILVGISPHPPVSNDSRLPHVSAGAERTIAKTALGAELTVPFNYYPDILSTIAELRQKHYKLYALEQSSSSTNLFNLEPEFPLALIVGHETAGLKPGVLSSVNATIEIPQFGHKESLNVSVAAGIALYFLRYQYQVKLK